MILEIAMLNIEPGQEAQFEQAFKEAEKIICTMSGYIRHDLRRGVEHPSRYALQVQWQTLEDHTVGFRDSPQFQQWRALLNHFYDGAPGVEHFQPLA